jgi:hypothetical protein
MCNDRPPERKLFMHRVLSLLLLAALVACQDLGPNQLLPPADGVGAFSDAMHNGNDRFYLLPPMVPNPAPTGIFNPLLQPRVAVCAINNLNLDNEGKLGDAPGCPSPIANFTMENGISIPDGEQYYKADWNTSMSSVQVETPYRILFFLSDQPTALLLGYADVAFASDMRGVKNIETGETISLVDGQALPIRFRIEDGASCAGEVDCGEAVVGSEGGIVTTVDGHAGVSIPSGALDGDVLITITQINPASQPWGKCLPTGLRQEEGCYDFATEPAIGTFNEDVTVAICLDSNALRPDNLTLHRFNPEESDGVVELDNAPENFLDCSGFSSLAFGPADAGALDRLALFAGRLLSPFATVLFPRTVFATDLGRGGLTDAFSSMGWAESTANSGEAPATSEPGASLSPVIQAMTAHNHDDENPVPASEATLRFEYILPNGELGAAPFELTTDALGQATPTWHLTEDLGIHTLYVSTRGTLDGTVGGQVVPDQTEILELRTWVSVPNLTCADDPECGQAVIGPNGGTVTTPNKHAGVHIPAFALDESVTVTVRRVNPADQDWGKCLPTGLRQEEGCYAFDTDPAIEQFKANVTLGVCLDPKAPAQDKLLLHRYDDAPIDPTKRRVFELPSASAGFLDCSGFGALGWEPDVSSFRWLASAAGRVLSPVRGLVVPRLAYATDLGRGGLTDAFSSVTWGEPVRLNRTGGSCKDIESPGASCNFQIEARTAHNHSGSSQRSNEAILYAEYTDPAGITTVLGPFNSGNAAVTGIGVTLTQVVGTHTFSITTRGMVRGQLVPDPTVPLVLTVEVQ